MRELSTLPPNQGWTLARDLLGLRIALTVIIGIALVLIAGVAYSGEVAIGVALASAGLAVQVVQDNASLPLTVGLRLGSISALELTRQVLSTLLIVLLVAVGAGLVPFLGVSIPVGVVTLALTMRLVRGIRRLAPTFKWERWRPLIIAMLPYSLGIAASTLYLRVSIRSYRRSPPAHSSATSACRSGSSKCSQSCPGCSWARRCRYSRTPPAGTTNGSATGSDACSRSR